MPTSRLSPARPARAIAPRTASCGRICRNGACSRFTARARRKVSSNSPSPVVLFTSPSSTVSRSVSTVAGDHVHTAAATATAVSTTPTAAHRPRASRAPAAGVPVSERVCPSPGPSPFASDSRPVSSAASPCRGPGSSHTTWATRRYPRLGIVSMNRGCWGSSSNTCRNSAMQRVTPDSAMYCPGQTSARISSFSTISPARRARHTSRSTSCGRSLTARSPREIRQAFGSTRQSARVKESRWEASGRRSADMKARSGCYYSAFQGLPTPPTGGRIRDSGFRTSHEAALLIPDFPIPDDP